MCLIPCQPEMGALQGPYTCGNTAGPPVSCWLQSVSQLLSGRKACPHSPASRTPTHACSWWPESSTCTCRETDSCALWLQLLKARLKVFCSSSSPVHLGVPALVPGTCAQGGRRTVTQPAVNFHVSLRLAPTMVFFPLSGRRQPILDGPGSTKEECGSSHRTEGPQGDMRDSCRHPPGLKLKVFCQG